MQPRNTDRERARTAARPGAGFSLVELVAVMAILSILSAAAVPLVGSIGRTQTHAVRASLVSSLAYARAHAVATGTPAGLRIDLDAQTATLLEALDPGPGVQTMTGPLGTPEPVRALSRADRTIVLRVDGADLDTHEPTLWFGFLGVPERRASNGSPLGSTTDITVIVLDQGDPIRVHPVTGMIE